MTQGFRIVTGESVMGFILCQKCADNRTVGHLEAFDSVLCWYCTTRYFSATEISYRLDIGGRPHPALSLFTRFHAYGGLVKLTKAVVVFSANGGESFELADDLLDEWYRQNRERIIRGDGSLEEQRQVLALDLDV